MLASSIQLCELSPSNCDLIVRIDSNLDSNIMVVLRSKDGNHLED